MRILNFQIQKFALRFYTGNDSQRFMDAVKVQPSLLLNDTIFLMETERPHLKKTTKRWQ